jgi:hypothetical protein
VNIRQPTSGGDFTLQRAATPGDGPDPFANTHAAGYRGVYDFADPDSSVFIIATGQSGHPLSRHYDDLGELWRRGEYIPMTLDPDLARAGNLGVMVLTPRRSSACRVLARRGWPASCARQGDWFHYSIDYRIGTAYMGEHITDNLKRQAMQVPFLADLLMSDSIYIGSNITFDNLAPLSTFLGKPGDPAKGRPALRRIHAPAGAAPPRRDQRAAGHAHFIDRARDALWLPHFVCDTGGSICEVVDPEDPMTRCWARCRHCLMVWIEGTEAHTELIRRFDRAPKPMYYQPDFLVAALAGYLDETACGRDAVDPDAFVRFAYARALAHRAPRYAAMGELGCHRHRRRGRGRARRRTRSTRWLIATALGRAAPPR